MTPWTVVHGILQTRIPGWGARPSSRGSSQPRDQNQVSCIAGGFFTSWATRKAQESWSGWPIPSPADLPDAGIEPGSPPLQVDSLPAEPPGKPNRNKVHNKCNALEASPNYPTLPAPHHLWKNCLPRNQSLEPKRLGTTALDCKGVAGRSPKLWFLNHSVLRIASDDCENAHF